MHGEMPLTKHQTLTLDASIAPRCMHGEMPLTNSAHSVPSKSALEDERRLMYVAMTRAKKFLTISHPSRLRGLPVAPSPFLSELPPLLLRRMQVDDMPVKSPGGGAGVGGGDGLGDASSCGAGGDDEETEGLPLCDAFFSCGFIKRFEEGERATISLLFHKWARKPAFADAPRLLAKVFLHSPSVSNSIHGSPGSVGTLAGINRLEFKSRRFMLENFERVQVPEVAGRHHDALLFLDPERYRV